MANQETDAAAKLRKLGARVRANFAKKHPATPQQVEAIRNTIRQEWERKRVEQKTVVPPPATKSKSRKPPTRGD